MMMTAGGDDDDNRNESYAQMLARVPLWFWLALVAPVVVGVTLALTGGFGR